MTPEMIQSSLNTAREMMQSRGYSNISARCRFDSDTSVPRISLSWYSKNILTGEDVHHYETMYEAESLSHGFALLYTFIEQQPFVADSHRETFLSALAKLIETGRDFNIPADFINPLEETMKRLSENVIEAPRTTHRAADRGFE
jgi:hypothetical protein